MQNITVTSTTDTPEAVIAAQGDLAQIKVVEPAAEETPAETLEASEPSDEIETEDAKEDGEAPKKKGGFQKKIGKLTKQREAARQEAEYWKSEALKKADTSAQTPAAIVEPIKVEGRPTADTFETHEEYVEALADWKVDQKLSARDQKTKELDLKSEQEKQLKGYIAKRDEFAKGQDDYFERMEDIQTIPMSLTVNEALLTSDNGPELLYELAKDPEEYKRICSLPAIAAAREIGKLEAKLAQSSESKPETKTTKAPKPLSPVGSSSSNTSTKKPDDMDFDEYKAWRAKHPKG